VLRPGALGLPVLRAVLPDLALGPATAASEAERLSPGQDVVHYAPRARLRLLPRAEALAEANTAAATDGRAGLLVRPPTPEPVAGVCAQVLPADPEGFGRGLFAALHALDDLGLARIFVEAPPQGDERWLAVADRLGRAAGKG